MSTPVALGARLALGAGRAGLVRAALVAGGVAVGMVVLLTAAAVPQLASGQLARHAARLPVYADGAGAVQAGLRVDVRSEPARRGRSVTVIDVAGAGTPSPLPPGVGALPRPGELVVSPALAEALPRDEGLRARFPGVVVAEVGDEGLLRPDELLLYRGVGQQELAGAGPVTRFGVPPADLLPYSDAQRERSLLAQAVLVFLGVPVLVLLMTVYRLSSTTRDRRLAALRLLGVSARSTRVVAGVESAVLALAGTLLGGVAFLLLRPLGEHVPVAGRRWFTGDLLPPPPLALALVLAVPLLAVLVSLAPARLLRAPLALRRSAPARRPSPWRLAPALLGAAVLLQAASAPSDGDHPEGLLPWVLAGIVLLGGGLPVAVPVLVRLLADVALRSRPAPRAGSPPAACSTSRRRPRGSSRPWWWRCSSAPGRSRSWSPSSARRSTSWPRARTPLAPRSPACGPTAASSSPRICVPRPGCVPWSRSGSSRPAVSVRSRACRSSWAPAPSSPSSSQG